MESDLIKKGSNSGRPHHQGLATAEQEQSNEVSVI